MKKRWKRILRICTVVLASVLLLVIAFALYVYLHKPALKGYVERTLSKTPGLTVTIGRLDYRLSPLRVEAESVKAVFVNALGRAEVFIGRIEGAGNLNRVIKGRKPYLDSLSVSGLKFDFAEDPNAPPSGPIDVRGLSRMVGGYLGYVGKLTVRDSSLHLGLPVEGMDMSAAGIGIRASSGGETKLALAAERLDFSNSKPAASLSAAVRCDASWPDSDPFRLEGNLDVSAASVFLAKINWRAADIGLKAGFSAGERDVTIGKFSVDLPGLISLSGSGQAGLGKNPVIEASTVLDVTSIDRAKEAFAPFLPPGLPPFSLDGALHWEGRIRRAASAVGAASVSVSGRIALPSSRLKMQRDGISVDQTLRADLNIDGKLPAVGVTGWLEGGGGVVAGNSFRAGGVSFRLPVRVQGSRVALSGFKAAVRELVLPAGGGKLALEGVSAGGSGVFDYAESSAGLDSLDVEIPRLGAFHLSGKAGPGPGRALVLNLGGRNLDVGGILKYFATFVPAAVTAWQPAGQADIAVEVRNAAAGPGRYLVKGALSLAKAAFQDAAGTIVSEGLEPRLRFEAEVASPGPAAAAPAPAASVPFSLDFELAGGESLLKDTYFNWKSEPVRLALRGRYAAASSALLDAEASLSFAPLGGLDVRGSASFGPRPGLDIHLAAPAVDLARLSAFLGKMRTGQPPAMEVQGKAEAAADVRFDGALRVRGLVKLRDAAVKNKDGSLVLAGVEADVPFSLLKGPDREKDGDDARVRGFLQIREVKTPAVVLEPIRIDFAAARNLFLVDPVEIGLWGARLRLGRTTLSLSQTTLAFLGQSTLSLSELDLAALPSGGGSLKLAGRAAIGEGALEIGRGELRFQGRLTADIYGGRLTLDGLRVADVFGPGRRIMFQAGIEGLDLDLLTDAVPFGDITGIVDVSLRDFAMSYGQPESFALTIRSVPRKGIPRKFSLKAVDNLSVISSGGQAAAPSNSFITKFIHRFNYREIGIACALRNDVFTLRGTIVEGGIQYLVRRATFFGIDVVNGKPVNTISFKDMLGRLERVGRSSEKK